MDHRRSSNIGGADSSSLTSVETMPSPKTEVRHRKLSRRRSSTHDLASKAVSSSTAAESESEEEEDLTNEFHYDSGFHGIVDDNRNGPESLPDFSTLGKMINYNEADDIKAISYYTFSER